MSDIYKVLTNLQINFKEYRHPAVYTCEEADKYYQDVPGASCKNIFLRNKNGKKHYLVIMESGKKLNIKELGDLIGEKKMGFASERRLLQYLGLTPGSVSPFGLINDQDHEVTVLIDQDLNSNQAIHFHPNTNTRTVVISNVDFLKFLKYTKNAFKYIEIPEIT